MRVLAIVLISVLVAGSFGCAAQKRAERVANLESLRVGQSLEEVKVLLGETRIGFQSSANRYSALIYPIDVKHNSVQWIGLCFKDGLFVHETRNIYSKVNRFGSADKPGADATSVCSAIIPTVKEEGGFTYRGIKLGSTYHSQIPPCSSFSDTRVCVDGRSILNAPDVGTSRRVRFVVDDQHRIVSLREHEITPYQAEHLLRLLSQKYGPPNEMEQSVVQNRMGAEFDQFHATWTIKNAYISLYNRLSKVDEGYLEISTLDHLERSLDKFDDDTARQLDNL